MPASLTLLDFSDLDLFFAWEDAEKEGWATAEDVAKEIGITHEHPAKCVGARFAWFKRFGWMENIRDGSKIYWRPTQKGKELFNPKKVSAATAKNLAGLNEGQRAQVMADLGRTVPKGSREGAHLAVRAFRNGMGGWIDPALATKRRK